MEGFEYAAVSFCRVEATADGDGIFLRNVSTFHHAARRHITEDNTTEIYCDSVILSVCFTILFLEQRSVFV